MTYEETLKENGWSFYASCQCGGLYRKKFRKPEARNIEVWVAPSMLTFEVQRFSMVEKRGRLIDLEQALKSI